MAVAVLDAVDQGRLHALAAIVEHRIGGDHAQQSGLAGAERKRQIRRQVVIDAEALGIVGDQRHADILRQPHRHHVTRALDAEAQRRRAVELALVIFRPPGFLAGALVDLQRRVQHDRGRRVAVIERGGIDDRLERRAGLPQRLRRAVELALVVGKAADHGEDASGQRIHRQDVRRKSPAPAAADTALPAPCRLFRSADRHRSHRRVAAPAKPLPARARGSAPRQPSPSARRRAAEYRPGALSTPRHSAHARVESRYARSDRRSPAPPPCARARYPSASGLRPA